VAPTGTPDPLVARTPSGTPSSAEPATRRPVIGLLRGDFPWSAPPRKVGKMLSVGVMARNLTRALGLVGDVVPYRPPAEASPAAEREALAAFLRAIDLLWADVYPPSEPALRLRRELDLPCPAVLAAEGAMPKGLEAMLFPWRGLLRPGDGLLATCAADRAIWRRLVRRSALREWVVPLGVDETVFRPRGPGERAATRARHGLPPDAPLLLYVGRLNIQKNLHALLRLFAAVRERAPDAHLCLVGEEDDIALGEFGARNTGYVAWLRALATELGVADGVTFVAGLLFGEDLARLYAAADVLVNAGFYHRENFGLAQAEAQACGVPVVCTAWGGFKDVVLPGETGFLMDAVLTKRGVRVDWATGARHVVALLRDPALRERMGARAAARARERFSVAALAHNLAGVVAEAGAPPGDAAAPDGGPAYAPSAFARRYEAHKRACGWYAAPDEGRAAWYPPMFEGRDYALYETLLGPYATRLAADLPPDAIQPDWVPYCPSGVALDPTRRVARDPDPVWPQQRSLTPLEWEILRQVDGNATVGQIAAALAAAGPPVEWPAPTAALWRLHVDGFVLFRTC
jgi:glycosyltransferase involved in cell wall biosynthesis